jgi:uncharacterized C2H2 Zn-finger protein
MNCPHCSKHYKYPAFLYRHIKSKHPTEHNNGKPIITKVEAVKEMMQFHLTSIKTLMEMLK